MRHPEKKWLCPQCGEEQWTFRQFMDHSLMHARRAWSEAARRFRDGGRLNEEV